MKNKYLYLFLFLFGTALYLNTVPNMYAYDDFSVVQGNKFTKQGMAGFFNHLFSDSFTGFTGQKNLFRGGRYRPLSLITFGFEYQFFKENPHVSHLVNAILYGFICMFLLKVLSLLFHDKLAFGKPGDYFLSLSLMAALIFAAHPIHTEVAANIKGRDELMALLFGLLAWKSILNYTDKREVVHGFYAGIFFFLALLSKESAAPFLVIIPVSIYCFRTKEVFRKSVTISAAALLAGFSLFMLIRQSVLGWGAAITAEDNILNNSFMYASGISERYGTTFYTLWLYVRLLLVPYPLTIDYYPYYIPYVGFGSLSAILPFILYVALTAVALLLTFRKNPAGFGIFFYLLALLPVSNLLFIVGPFMGERFAFIPSVGFIIAVTWLFIKGAERIKQTKYLGITFTTVILLYSGITISRNSDWKDSFTLYTHDVNISVNSAVITKGAGHEFLLKAEETRDPAEKRAFAQKAIPYLEKAVKMNKSTTETLLLGNAYYENGEFEPALGMFMETLKLSKTYEKAYTNYLVTVNRLPSPALKLRYLDQLLTVTGARYEPYYTKGLVFGKEMNMLDSSIINLSRASMIDSTKFECLSDLGVAFAMKGNFVQSAVFLEKALRINPSDAKVRQNLAASYFNTGNIARARELTGQR